MPMRGLWQGFLCGFAVLTAVGGCASRDIALRPPKHPDEIAVPPTADARFTQPPKYPEGTLNQNTLVAKNHGGLNGVPNMGSMNMGGGGMGGGGMGGMGGGNMGMGGMGMGGMGMGGMR